MEGMIKILKFEDNNYPESLKRIDWPPKELYVLGNEKLLNEKSIAIIGSRLCTENGKKTATEYARYLSKAGFTIVSGMAKGIDTASHIGALKGSKKTIAVLGSGFRHIFPKENIELFKEILKNGGAIISEYPENTEIRPKQFVERNRIVSGLSLGVLVVEAKTKSGTFITANFAKRQGKRLFFIPQGIDKQEGINLLIKKGANIVTRPEDIVNELYGRK